MPIRTREILWTTRTPAVSQLQNQGFHVLEYTKIKSQVFNSRATGSSRSSLNNPAHGILELLRKHPKVAVLGAPCSQLEDLRIIYGYLVEPAFRCCCTLLVSADLSLPEISGLARSSSFNDPQWRYPWTIERMLHIVNLGRIPHRQSVPVDANRWRRLWNILSPRKIPPGLAPLNSRLDGEQTAAVHSGDGVVQIIAPAGSGKTTVLVERVKELQRRGTPTSRILCMSFNRDAKVEIGERLIRAGVGGVTVRSFHGMGLAILKHEGRLRSGIGCIEDHELEHMISLAMEPGMPPGGNPIPESAQDKKFTVAEARNAICEYKLATMISPEEAMQQAVGSRQWEGIAARTFALYQQELARRNILDFDDLVAQAVTLLQTHKKSRQHWQKTFDRVLVDEYQDIEPAQALLVGILAAPQDSLFCVGDEDQCIYAWRRATVQRIIELDQVYPGLERHALIRNYRCGRRITNASRRLIQHNRIRFRKPLQAGAKDKGNIVAVSCSSRAAAAGLVAHLIHDANPKDVAVLARTSRLLAEVAAACDRHPGGNPGVELATIHASKGREWDRVILFAIDEGQSPHAQALIEGDLEDERRLFYVAMTRAKTRLEILCTEGKESRFLKEAGIISMTQSSLGDIIPSNQQNPVSRQDNTQT